MQKLHRNFELPKKKDKNKKFSSEKVVNENVIGVLKRFKLMAEKIEEKDLDLDLILFQLFVLWS
ncbi:hypothetical protein HE1_00064 [Holospora elegans E1]|uniref:Uncharacterized protein n=1 Tax=Holospora elegans E1 TaxID=1427503 RepID=A0A023DXU1_9PROT|nr:hypothetical protein HE1_00064 [Holospora elegans E1]